MCNLTGCNEETKLPRLAVAAEARRAFLLGLAGLPLAVVLADRALAQSAAATLDSVSLSLPGGEKVAAALARPKGESAGAVILIHEWWGLNDQIKAVAAELAGQGYTALAVDLFGGKVAKTPEEAKAQTVAVDPARARATLVAWHDRLRAEGHRRIAVMGWCFGGGWALNAALAAPFDAAIVYYGNVAKNAADLKDLRAPVLGHFGRKDKSINEAMVAGFEAALGRAGKRDLATIHWYDADHAFANPTGARYDAEDAALAWQRTLHFLKQTLV